MKKVLFATTALATLAVGGIASAQGISLFGSARLGLGYGINNDGTVNRETQQTTDDQTVWGDPTNDIRAISRVRFGVNMTGETNSGITFGATIRADNAIGGNGGGTDGIGQTAGDVFVSGSYGTLTFGDTNGADEQWVGDLVGDYSLTGLGDLDETAFISNGGGFGNDDTNNIFNDPNARPTVRYDYEFQGFGISVSSNKDLNAVGVGGGYSGTFTGGTFNIGLGYYDYTEFRSTGFPGAPIGTYVTVPGGNEYSAVLGGTYGDFGANIIYNNADSDGNSFETLGLGLTAGFGDWDFGAWYRQVIKGDGALAGWDGAQAYGISGQYDLGGGATVMGGVVRTYSTDDTTFTPNGSTTPVTFAGVEPATVADFGISMDF
ncbi:MAG: porin [Amaricoccus sp.]